MNIIHLVSNKVWGGGERYVLDLARAQRADGHSVGIFTRRYEAVAKPFADEKLHSGYLHLGGVIDVVTPVRLAKHLRGIEGPVIVHVHNFKDAYTAVAARRLCDRKDIYIIATRHLVRPAKTDKSHLRTLAALDAVIFVSQLAHDRFCSTLPTGFDRSRLHTVVNSIAIPSPLPYPEKDHENPPRLIYAGRLAHEKGIDVLLEAMALISDHRWKLDIVGSGLPRDEVAFEKQARALGIADRIDFKGHKADVFAELAGADIAVLPSRVAEACPLIIQEAYACRVAVVTTDLGAQPETVDDGVTGLLVAPESPRALADAIGRLLDDRDLCHRMGEAGHRKLISDLSYDKFYKFIMAIYDGCQHHDK